MIEKAGHILEYLPPYSPDLNPIEPKWSQAKSRRRKYRCDVDRYWTDFSRQIFTNFASLFIRRF